MSFQLETIVFLSKYFKKIHCLLFREECSLTLGYQSLDSSAYKDHKINASARPKVQYLIGITCFSVSIWEKKNFNSKTLKA